MSYRSRNASGDAWAVISRIEADNDWAARVEAARKAGTLCPTCGEIPLTRYQVQHHYHCDRCTRQTESGY